MKIAVLVSGGVDSSVALALLKQQGHDVTAFYLKIWLEDELAFLGECPWQEDLEFVKKVCNQLEVPLEIVNLQKEYFAKVVDLAITQIKNGLTPNPDIFCNSQVKFGVFFDYLTSNYDFVATGHYAKVVHEQNQSFLKITPDKIKDQTYFLAKLSQSQLKKALFVLGDLTKAEVRELAQKFDLPNQARKDSQGLCFLGKINFSDFIKAYLGEKNGDLIEFETGKKLGNHSGSWFFTIGQRKGIGLSGGPWFVVKKDKELNQVFISNHYFDPDKKRDSFNVVDLHWISGEPISFENILVKLRHGPESIPCILEIDKIEQTKAFVKIARRDQSISPGQFAVFYQNDYCLGSAMIDEEVDY